MLGENSLIAPCDKKEKRVILNPDLDTGDCVDMLTLVMTSVLLQVASVSAFLSSSVVDGIMVTSLSICIYILTFYFVRNTLLAPTKTQGKTKC